MEHTIKKNTMGKLRVYLEAGESVKSNNIFRKIFPKNAYSSIMNEAKKDGLLHAHVYHTNASYRKDKGIHHKTVEGDHTAMTICLELMDEKQNLEIFFIKHADLFKGKTVVYKEVEQWHID